MFSGLHYLLSIQSVLYPFLFYLVQLFLYETIILFFIATLIIKPYLLVLFLTLPESSTALEDPSDSVP